MSQAEPSAEAPLAGVHLAIVDARHCNWLWHLTQGPPLVASRVQGLHMTSMSRVLSLSGSARGQVPGVPVGPPSRDPRTQKF